MSQCLIGKCIRLISGFVCCFNSYSSFAASTLDVPRSYASIQAAINAAQSGDVVLVATGTYRERLRISEGVIVRSQGDDARGKLGLKRAEETVLDGGGVSDVAGVTLQEGAVLDGFTVTNVGRYDDAEWQKHHSTHGNEQSHEHIGAPGTAGISVTGVSCLVTNNIVHHIGYSGIAITGMEGRRCSPTILRNVCYRNMGGGIGSMRGSTATIEHNICFQNFYAGIGHEGAHPLVLNNECYENIRAGIGVSEGARPIVRGNRCYRNRRAGIGVRTGAETSPVIEFNDCFENEMAGIGCEESATPIIRGNKCHHNKLAGIGCQDHSAPLIAQNECAHNDLSGIGARDGAQPVIHGNSITNNKQSGIGIEGGSSVVLIKNICRDNGLVALGVRHESTVLAAGNSFERQGGVPPLVAVKESSTAQFLNNTLRGGGVTGILADGNVVAVGNEFHGEAGDKGGPPGSAVWAVKNSKLWLSNNRMDGCRTALQADGAERVTALDNQIRRFVGSALIVRNTTGAVRVSGNVAESRNQQDQVLTFDDKGVTPSNELRLDSSPRVGSER